MTLQEHYYAIKSGKGNKDQFLKQARNLFPEYFTQYTDFDTATNVLKSKQIISEAAGGVVSKGFDIYDWKKILAEEAKAEEKETSKEVLDDQNNAYNNSDMKNADNVNFNEIMKGFYAELRDEKNAGKTGDEIKAMVVKNLAKDPLFYTKDGMFGEKGVGYTTEAPGLGQPKEPKGKHKSSGYGDLDADIKIEKVKSNVQDSLGDREAETSMPRKVKEMPDKGVIGVEKKMKLQENIDILENKNEQKLRSLIHNIIKEALDESKYPTLYKNSTKVEYNGKNGEIISNEKSINQEYVDYIVKFNDGEETISSADKGLKIIDPNKGMVMWDGEKMVSVNENVDSNETDISLNEASIKSDELQKFSRDIYAKNNEIYISPKLEQSLTSSYFNRGPSSYERTKSDPDQTRSVYLNIDSGFRSMLKKGLNGALVTSLPGVKNSELPSKTTPALQYKWIKLNFPEKDYDIKISDDKITINKKSKEELEESVSDKDIQIKYNEMFGKNPATTFADVAKALNIPEDQAYSALIAPMGGISIREQKLRSLIRNVIKEALNEGPIKINGKTVRTYTQNGDTSYNVEYDDGTKDRIAVSNDAWDEINALHMNATNSK
jgi:hypothetical protein